MRLPVAWNTQESFFFCHWTERLIAPQLQQTWVYKSVCRAWLMWVRHVSGLLRCMWIKLRLRLAFIICTWNFHQVVCNMLSRLTKQNDKFCHTNCLMQYNGEIHPSHTELGVWNSFIKATVKCSCLSSSDLDKLHNEIATYCDWGAGGVRTRYIWSKKCSILCVKNKYKAHIYHNIGYLLIRKYIKLDFFLCLFFKLLAHYLKICLSMLSNWPFYTVQTELMIALSDDLFFSFIFICATNSKVLSFTLVLCCIGIIQNFSGKRTTNKAKRSNSDIVLMIYTVQIIWKY